MINVGIDIIEIKRIQNVKSKYPSRFLKKIFTENEIIYCRENPKRNNLESEPRNEII